MTLLLDLKLVFGHLIFFLRQREEEQEEQEDEDFPFNMSDFVTVDEVGDVTDLPGSPGPAASLLPLQEATPCPDLGNTNKVYADFPVWVLLTQFSQAVCREHIFLPPASRTLEWEWEGQRLPLNLPSPGMPRRKRLRRVLPVA